jgi:hypothetical protein
LPEPTLLEISGTRLIASLNEANDCALSANLCVVASEWTSALAED